MTEKKFTSWGNRIKRDGKLLNIEFKTKNDAKLCCKLCNQMDKDNQEYIDKLDEIFKWYKDYYGETILDTKMGWNEDNKISKLENENEQLKKENEQLKHFKEISNNFTKEVEDFFEKHDFDTVNFDVIDEVFDEVDYYYEKCIELKKENEDLKKKELI